MNLLYLKQTHFFGYHLLLWVGVWFFYLYFFSYSTTNSLYVTWFSSILLPLTMVATYTTVYYLIPTFLLKKRYWLFGLYSLYLAIFVTWLVCITMIGSFIFLSNLNVTNMPLMSRNLFFILILIYLVVGLVSFVSMLSHNFDTLSRNKALENKLLDGQLQLKQQELQYLKKQIHPHFLFNALNTIYGFALKKSDRTPEIILKLSNLLDYILYQVQEKSVPLQQELDHITEYISLEKMRFQDTLEVTFTRQAASESLTIPPMLFLPLVENAFKHGSIINGKMRVDIHFEEKEEEIIFNISNSHKGISAENKSGIGLENIKKRLDLLYPGRYKLTVGQQERSFKANLKISLHD